jgi:23S rRNA (cytosine1962-C5)-methyltransferase
MDGPDANPPNPPNPKPPTHNPRPTLLSSGVPAPSTQRLAVRVTRDAQRQIRGGHPWLFDASITAANHAGQPGDIAVVFDQERRFVAIGLYDPESPIRVRLLHQGKPVTIDEAWWGARLDAAIDRRSGLVERGDTTGYRVIHGENDGFGGLVLDRYASTLVLKIYSAAWLPWLATLLPLIVDRLAPERVVLRLSRGLQRRDTFGLDDGTTLFGTAPLGPVRFLENGLTFEADVIAGMKTGHFLDQRDNRQRVRELARGARVLDMFAATGGFTVYAASGGATHVHSVDLSPGAIATTERNLAHNRAVVAVRSLDHRATVGDAFDVMASLARARERYDIVVVDPPSFAAKSADVERALSAYRRLTEMAVALVEPGGLLVQSSCSSRIDAEEFFATVTTAAARAGRRLVERERTTHAVDHPVGFAQGAYLKTLFATVP